MHSIQFEEEPRIQTDIKEFDRVLGGGIVPGTLVLIGGDPGIGKSTLMLQVLAKLSLAGKKTLYVSGEESIRQLKMRGKGLRLTAFPCLWQLKQTWTISWPWLNRKCPAAMVVDSIQTVYNPDIASTPGSVTQIREASMRLMSMAKKTGVPLFLVGHVTKGGAIAGPRIMEHMWIRFFTLKGIEAMCSEF